MRPILAMMPVGLLLMTTVAFLPAQAGVGPFEPVLVEVSPNPEGADTDREWFELANPTAAPLLLTGWSVTDHDGCYVNGKYVASYAMPLDGITVPPLGRVQVTISGLGSCLRLTNTNDELTLLAPDGATAVQTIAWGSNGDVAAPKEGQSVAACVVAANLHGAWDVHPATPGEANPSCVLV